MEGKRQSEDVMFQRIIVPIDGSQRSWSAARVGSLVAEATDAELELVTVVFAAGQANAASSDLRQGVERMSPLAVQPFTTALVARPGSDDGVGSVIARHAESVSGSMVVMSSTGRGRSAAVLGSVADDVLRAMFGPIIVVGPHVFEPGSFSGDIVVPVDGSEFSETSLPLAASWGIALGATPWIVEVLTDAVPLSSDVLESSYAARLARDLRVQTHHDVEFEVLHGPSASHAIADYAKQNKARLIVMSTHGRSGIRRLTLGSTAASVVHDAICPVVLHRPPRFALD